MYKIAVSSGYNQLVHLNSLVTYLGNTVFFLKINKIRLWRVNSDIFVIPDLGESQKQVWEVLTSRPNLLLKANWPRRWGNNVPKKHLAQVSIQAFFFSIYYNGEGVWLIVTNFLESESLVVIAVHIGQFMMFLETANKTNVILCSLTLYIYMNGKVSYP